MSIVPGRDVPEVPEAWVDAVNKRINDENHDDLCACRGWPDACVTGYRPGLWDIGVSLDIAIGVLEPLIRDRIAAESRKPNKAVVTRQLKAAGHAPWNGKDRIERRTPGFRVALNKSIIPDGVAVIHMAEFDKPEAVAAALESYARTLTGLGYDARMETLFGTLHAIHVRRPANSGDTKTAAKR